MTWVCVAVASVRSVSLRKTLSDCSALTLTASFELKGTVVGRIIEWTRNLT